MKYKNIIMIFALFAVVLNACDRDVIFEGEMYKAQVALKGDVSGGFNIFEQEHDFDAIDANGWTNGFISANVGGSLPTTQPIVLTIREDNDLLMKYNQTNFELEDFRYALSISQNRYSVVAGKTITIPAGERNGIMRMRFKLENLSPDSIYFIPFKVEQTSAYELFPEKSTVLYRAHFKNFWATTKTVTEYSHRGLILQKSEVDSDPPATRTPTYLNKRMYPVSRDEIRVNGGRKAFSAGDDPLQVIPRWSMRIKIASDGKLTIEPWDKSEHLGFKVTQVNNDSFDLNDRYLNTYELVDNGFGKLFRTFRLCYDFIEPGSGVEYRIWEELRLEYKPITIQ